MNSKKRKLRNHDLRSEGHNLLKAEGNEWLHRGASPNIKTFGPKGATSVVPKVATGLPEA